MFLLKKLNFKFIHIPHSKIVTINFFKQFENGFKKILFTYDSQGYRELINSEFARNIDHKLHQHQVCGSQRLSKSFKFSFFIFT